MDALVVGLVAIDIHVVLVGLLALVGDVKTSAVKDKPKLEESAGVDMLVLALH